MKTVRLAAYNVLFGNWGTPRRIGEMLKRYDLDVIGFCEVPDGDWTARVGNVLGMDHACVGAISSANHKDKYKSILSRTPLTNAHEIEINAPGWSPASLVGAETTIDGLAISLYSLHIPGAELSGGSAAETIAAEVIPSIQAERFVMMGDFNNQLGDESLNVLEEAGMRPAWRDLNIDVAKENSWRHIETAREGGVLDHIFYNAGSGARAVDGGVIYDAHNPPDEEQPMADYHAEWEAAGKPLSDHRPVWAELAFPRETSPGPEKA